jgi:autotransporter passenger strand-loop-strand repeat protein
VSIDLQDLSRRLFKTAEQLWTNTALRPDQYAKPVLALIALRQMETKFDLVHASGHHECRGCLFRRPAECGEGLASGTNVYDAGTEYISGGTVSALHVNSGGAAFMFDGTARGTVLSGGGASMSMSGGAAYLTVVEDAAGRQ